MKPSELYNAITMLDWHNPIIIDFESFYDKEWSLSKITTEKYIRGNQWECIGGSIKVGNQTTKFYRGEHPVQIIRELVQAYPNRPFISHNNTFDMGILGLRYNIHPKFMIDTAIMAKLCGLDRVAGGTSLAKLSDQLEKMGIVQKVKGTTVHNMIGVHKKDMTEQQWIEYSDYCCLDTDLCYALYMYMLPFFDITKHEPHKISTSELIMADITTKMWTKPMIEIDVPLLEDYATRLETDRNNMLSKIAGALGFRDNNDLLSNLRSSKKFVAILERLGIDVPQKWSEKQEKMIPAVSKTDLEFLELLEHPNELVRTLVETKLGTMSSMEQTRTATFLDVASRGLMPVPLRYASAHTGRYGGSDKLNFQNLSKRTKDPVLRRSMKAKTNHVWVAADSSQIEARLLAYLAKQDDVVQVFVNNQDVYIDMACKIYNEPYEVIYEQSKGANATKEGKMKRNIAKAVVLGAGYGASAAKFAELMKQQGLAEQADMADDLIATYRSSNNMISQFWRECDRVLDVLYAGGSMWFGGPDNNIFFADGSTEFHGKTIPSIRGPNGTYIFYQNLRKEAGDNGREQYVYDQFKGRNWLPKRIWGSALAENLTQFLAFVMLKWQAIEIAKTGLPINLNVHDEWASVVPRSMVTDTTIIYYKAMKNVPPYLPQGLLDCEVDVGLNYADLKTVNVAKYIGV